MRSIDPTDDPFTVPHPLSPAIRSASNSWVFYSPRAGENAPPLPRVLAFHGFAGGGLDFEALARTLQDVIQLEACDLPGHGAWRGPWTTDALRPERLAAAFSERLTPEQPVWLLGYSLGARLAILTAAQRPDGVAGLILIGAQRGIMDPSERARRREQDEQWLEILRKSGAATFAREWEDQGIIATQHRTPPPWGERLRGRRRMLQPEAVASCLELCGPGAMEPLDGALARYTGPIHLLHGAEDQPYQDHAARWARIYPRISVHAVPHAGHAPHLEHPEGCAELIRQIMNLR